MREFTIQWMQDQDWVRTSAVYDNLEDCLIHAKDMLTDGLVVRVLTRETKHGRVWHTITLNSSGMIASNNPVNSCPQ